MVPVDHERRRRQTVPDPCFSHVVVDLQEVWLLFVRLYRYKYRQNLHANYHQRNRDLQIHEPSEIHHRTVAGGIHVQTVFRL